MTELFRACNCGRRRLVLDSGSVIAIGVTSSDSYYYIIGHNSGRVEAGQYFPKKCPYCKMHGVLIFAPASSKPMHPIKKS